MKIGEKDKFYIYKSRYSSEWVVSLPKRLWGTWGNTRWMKSWKDCIKWADEELQIEDLLNIGGN